MKPFPPILFLTAEYDASGRYSLSARRQNGEEGGGGGGTPPFPPTAPPAGVGGRGASQW